MERGTIRLAEVVAALALGTDLGVGKPIEHSLGACLVATGLGRELGLDGQALSDTYYVSLLIMAGCTAGASGFAALVGDEMPYGRHFATVDRGSPPEMLLGLIRHVGEGRSPLERLGMALNLLTRGMPTIIQSGVAHCEVARGLAGQLGLNEGVQETLLAINERWNGKGGPKRLRGDAVPLPIRIAQVAFDAAAFYLVAGGIEPAVAMARDRAGGSYDPEVVEHFCAHAPELLGQLDAPSVWEAVLAAEPGSPLVAGPEEADDALAAIGQFTDLKSPFTSGHSQGVARLAGEAARACRLPEGDIRLVRRAGLIHDLGRVAISANVWNKRGPLTEGEWEQVRLHPYYTERATNRSGSLAPLGTLAALHHERLDGSGYHRSLPAGMLSPAARILAAADAYHAMTEERPHREALLPDQAAEELQREVKSGRLDGEAVDAVLTAAGHRVAARRRARPGGLSEREVEVLQLLARGLSNKQMAAALFIAEKTVGHHIQHIYDKIGVSTRPAATLFAMQHELLGEPAGPGTPS